MNELKDQINAHKERHSLPLRSAWAIIGGVFFVTVAALGLAAYSTAGIRLTGNKEETIVLGESYLDKGCEASVLGVPLQGKILTQGTVDTARPGTYTMTYRVEGMNWVGSAVRKVEVRDIKIPELTLAGETQTYVELNGIFQEPGCKAVDDYDGDITAKIVTAGEVDPSTPGEYPLTYSVMDSSGNEAKETRLVTVLPPSPLTMDLAEFSLSPYYDDVLLPKTEEEGATYMEETVFVGDSITENGMVNGIYPRKGVWARHALDPALALTTPVTIYGGGEDNKDTEMLILEAAEKYQPKRMLANLGSNYAFKTSPEQVAADYDRFLTAVLEKSPHTLILISTIYPVNRGYDDSEKSAYLINNDKINKINCALAELCRRKGYKLLNVAEALKDEDGHAVPGYLYEEDGIHPNSDTYAIIDSYIRTHVYFGETGK